jgi:putative tricarboxylic transport membrane protein
VTQARRRLIELVVLAGISLLGGIHGVLLIAYPDPVALYDEIGPGRFLVAVSGLLLVVAMLYVVRMRARADSLASQPEAARAVRVVAVLALYAVLLDLVGFLLATFGFLLALFACLRCSSWRRSLLTALAYSLVLYLLFVHALEMELPRGALLERWYAAQDVG